MLNNKFVLTYNKVRRCQFNIISISMSFVLQQINTSNLCQLDDPNQQSRSQLFKLKTSNIQNAKPSSLIQWKQIIFDTLTCIMNIICLFLAIMYNFLDAQEEQFHINILSTLFAGCSIIFNIFASINKKQLINTIKHNVHLQKYTHLPEMIGTSLFLAIHPNSLCHGIQVQFFDDTYNLNMLFASIQYLRLIYIIGYLLKMSRFSGLRVSRILDLYGVKDTISVKYAIKSLFHSNPLRSALMIYAFLLTFVPFFQYGIFSSQNATESYFQIVYDMIVTMATVGYGDMVHVTWTQRLLCILIIVAGSFSSSVLTLAFLDFFSLTEQQEKAFVLMKRMDVSDQITKQKQKVAVALMGINKNKPNKQKKLEMVKDLLLLRSKQYKTIQKQNQRSQPFQQMVQKNYFTLSKEIKILGERQMLTINLLQFFLARRRKADQIDAKKQQHLQSGTYLKSRRRVEDNQRIEQFKELITQNL